MTFNLDALTRRQPGPIAGCGATPHGRPFTAVVGDVPVFWATWLAHAARAARVDPAGVIVTWYGVALPLVPLQVGFGTRWYFECPMCENRREVVYRAAGQVGCAKCLHLGYQSQTSRSTSRWRLLRALYGLHEPTRRNCPPPILAALAAGFEAALTREAGGEAITVTVGGTAY